MSDDARSGFEPIISCLLPDWGMVELIYDPERRQTALAVSGPQMETRIESGPLDDGLRLQPYSAGNNPIASGCALFTSDVAPFLDKAATLLETVQASLNRCATFGLAGVVDEFVIAYWTPPV